MLYRTFVFSLFLLSLVVSASAQTIAFSPTSLQFSGERYRPSYRAYLMGGLNTGTSDRYSTSGNAGRGFFFAYERSGIADSLVGGNFITGGVMGGLRSFGYLNSYYGDYSVSSLLLAGRVSILIPQLLESINGRPIGFNFIEPYLTFTSGYEYVAADWAGYAGNLTSRTFVGGAVGARFYLLPNLGGFVEVGPNGQGFLQFGAIMRLGKE